MENKKNIEEYLDIINLPHPVSLKHKQMSIYDRAAQFAPFAALTGHKEKIDETGYKNDSIINKKNDLFEED